MVDLVVRYLSFQKKVSLQGIGTFSVEHLPARLDFPNRLLYAPEYILHYSSSSVAGTDEQFDNWLQKELNVSWEEVKTLQQNLTTDFERTLAEKGKMTLNGLGTFTKDDQKLLHFSSLYETVKGNPVTAEKVIRKNTSHSVLVGEQEKTSEEMTEILTSTKRKPLNLWWMITLALFLSALIAILLYAIYSPQWSKQGNNQKLKLNEAAPLHKIQ
jgi:nucleoid DNA-binding protein